MKKTFVLLIFFFDLFTPQTHAQDQRYLDPVFDEVLVTDSMIYGVNASILFYQTMGEAVPQPLYFDLYEPFGDTLSNRPLVLLFHSGLLLPFPENNLSVGTMKDSAIVYLATELAKRGYVVASCDYRLGWNPVAGTQDERLFGFINAIYRGIQDARTAIRYFKFSHEHLDNPYRINPCKLTLWGMDTGGYLSLGAASLDDYTNEIALLDKFIIVFDPQHIPVINPTINGDIDGTSVGIAPAGYPFPEGDTLCYENHTEFNSDFQMAVNMGGAVGDSSWVDENTVPTLSFHWPTSYFSPYTTGFIFINILGGLPVLEVSGSYDYQRRQQQFGNHLEWEAFDWSNFNWPNDITSTANLRNDGLEGLMPLLTETIQYNTPWDWWANELDTQFGSSDPITAKANIDTAINYFAPRACITLNLGCGFTDETYFECDILPVDEITEAKIDLKIFPNPTTDLVHFITKKYPIKRVQIYDLTGRLVKEYTTINSYEFEMQRSNLGNGVYFAQVWFEDDFISKQIIFQE